ncbi:MAG: Rieske (2Fe-2S) protein [Anaerolinea sp.]|nr:Rieske (2Fe-2S) protein [Anaerolinea sp.]
MKKVKAGDDGFYTAVAADAVHENGMTTVKLAGKKVILTRWQGRVVAFSAICPHAAADLSQGELHRGKIRCPEHDYKFDVGNGRILFPPDEMYCLQRYAVKEEGGSVKVRL